MAITASSEGEILLRLIDPDRADLSPDAAQSLLELEFSAEDLQYMDELAEKARQGSLSPAEQVEIENYERVNNLLGILKSKARQSLRATQDRPS